MLISRYVLDTPEERRCVRVLCELKQRKRPPQAPEWPRAPAAHQAPTAWPGGGALETAPFAPQAMGEGRGAQGRAAKWAGHRAPQRGS